MSLKSFLQSFDKGDTPDKNKGDKKQQEMDWTEKRRDNRIDVDGTQALKVKLEASDGAKQTLSAAVKNVSVRGCRLIFEAPVSKETMPVGKIWLASLLVDDFPIPLQVEVVRLMSEKEAAVRFKPPFPRELEKLEKFLEPRCLGRSLREIDRGKLQNAPDEQLRWFQGVNETSLFSWADSKSGAIAQQQLVFLDRVVEWKTGESIKTGLIRADERSTQGHVGWVQSELMDFDAIPDPATLHLAKTLLESSDIDGAVKQAFLKHF